MSKVFAGFKNYGFWEWFALVVGVVIASRPVIQYVKGDYDHISGWADTGILIVPLGAFILGTVLMAAPKTVLGAFKSRFTKGIDKDK